MRIFARFGSVAAALAVMTAVAFAGPSVVGNWKGKVQLDTSKLPKMDKPEQQKMMTQMLEQVKQMSINLNVKANNTFAVNVANMPGGGPAQNAAGTWKLQGETLTLVTTTENGKPASESSKKPQTLTVSKDGKSMTMSFPGQMGGKVVFTRV